MNISGPEALDIVTMWQNESTLLIGMVDSLSETSETPLARLPCRVELRGAFVVAVGVDSDLTMAFDSADAEWFEYQDSREAPADVKDWAEINALSLLIIRASDWRLSLLELKLPDPATH